MSTAVLGFQGTVAGFRQALIQSRKLAMKTGGRLADPFIAARVQAIYNLIAITHAKREVN